MCLLDKSRREQPTTTPTVAELYGITDLEDLGITAGMVPAVVAHEDYSPEKRWGRYAPAPVKLKPLKSPG